MLHVRPARDTRVALSWRERGAARLAGVLGVALALLPSWVWACPACVQKAPESSVRSALLVGGMLLVPFGMVALGVLAARQAARGDAQRSP